jgi:hypothetical protein
MTRESTIQFLKDIVDERIAMHTAIPKDLRPADRTSPDETILSQFTEEQRQQIDIYCDDLISAAAACERNAYLGGLADGIHITSRLLLTISKDLPTLDEWLKQILK